LPVCPHAPLPIPSSVHQLYLQESAKQYH
jgi:hypothetical protein